MHSDEMGFMQLEVLLGGLILAIATSGLMCIGLTERARTESIGELTASMIAQEQLSRIGDNLESYIGQREIPWLGNASRLQQNRKNFQIQTTMSPAAINPESSDNGVEILEAVVYVSWQNQGAEKSNGERVWRRYFSVEHEPVQN